MKKTQLNKKHRELLFQFIAKKITKAPTEDEAACKAVLDVQIPALAAEIEKAFPQDHMRILKLYDLARVDRCVKLKADDACSNWNYVEARIPEVYDFPLIASRSTCSARFISKAAYDALLEISRAQEARKEALTSLQYDYNKLVIGCKSFEELCEIWEEAKELSSEIVNSSALPATINPSLIERIKKDTEQRQKAVA